MTALACIEIAVALPVQPTYTYNVPEEWVSLAAPGKRVFVPFGRQRVMGYILHAVPEELEFKTKSILDILDPTPLFPESMVPFFRWIADYYMHPIGEVIKGALPSGLNLKEVLSYEITEKGRRGEKDASLAPMERQILSGIHQAPKSFKTLNTDLGMHLTKARLISLEKKEYIRSFRVLKKGTTAAKIERYVGLAAFEKKEHHLSDAQNAVVKCLAANGEMPVKALKRLAPSAGKALKGLTRAGVIRLFDKKIYRDPFGDPITPDTPPELSDEQKGVVDTVINALTDGFVSFLLAGVTGSGKTEVYMRLAAAVLQKKHTALVLVPEIALISQTERRFRARFGDRVAVLHSALSPGERFDQWMRILNEDVAIVIGVRSAIFAPLRNIGIIIVDEEHDTSYKQENNLRYNARDIAIVRAKQNHCTVLLGSATPSLQSYYNACQQKYRQVRLNMRINRQALPEICLVDLKESKDERGIRRFITPVLIKAMQETLARGEQVLLFLNRRGFATYPICHVCGKTIRCRHCDVTMTLHKKQRAYQCHLCGLTVSASISCPTCGSSGIKLLGLGTEKVEEAVRKLFPDANVGRLDRDTTKYKGSMLKLLKQLKLREIDIMIGTQMVAKGHDFPNITLVGILCADQSLNYPDFRAGETTFQLLAQVAGRAGRGERPGKVIMQSFQPQHFSIQAARKQDFERFYEKELPFRQGLRYPPFARLILIRISGKNVANTRKRAITIGEEINRIRLSDVITYGKISVLGPVEAPLPRIAGYFRWHILLKSDRIKPMQDIVRRFAADNASFFRQKEIKIVIDVDPFSMS